MTEATVPMRSTALVVTDRPGRYGKQLCSHLGRRATAAWDESAARGEITFGEGTAHCRLIAVERGLRLELDAPETELDRLEDVVGRHLVRFGAKDELTCSWQRSDGNAGGVFRNEE